MSEFYSGSFFREAMYIRQDEPQIVHYADIHWAVSEAKVISREFTFDELWMRSIPVLPLGQAARTLSLVDALLLACAHLALHREWDRLIWIYDIHLLAGRLNRQEAEIFVRRASEKHFRAVCRAALQLAVKHFGTRFDGGAIESFVSSGDRYRRYFEASAHYLPRKYLLLHDFLLHLRIGDWRERLRLLRRVILTPQEVKRLQGWQPHPWLGPFWQAYKRVTGAVRRASEAGDR